MPLDQFMDRLEMIVLGMIGITVAVFMIVAYVVCKIYDRRNNDE